MDMPSNTGRSADRHEREGLRPQARLSNRGFSDPNGIIEPCRRRRRAAGEGGRIVTLTLVLLALAGMALAVLNAVPEVGGATEPPAAPLPPGMSRADGARPAPRPLPSDRAPTEQIPTYQPDLHASSIRIPVLGVTATIGRATLHDGVLSPPPVPTEVGLWAGSASLEAGSGEVTIVGHVDWVGMPAFAFGRLAYLHAGDLVYTADRHGAQTAWRVIDVTARPKSDGVDLGAFAGSSGRRSLALITCGGAFDASSSSYEDNVYAYASPVRMGTQDDR
jgi:hypothetical protein